MLYIRNSPQPSKPSSGSLWWRWLFTEVAPVRSLAQEFLCALGAAKGGKKPQHRHPLLQAACHNLPARRFPPLRSPSLGRTALTLELTLHLPPPPWATCHPHLYLGRTGAPSASTGIDMKTLILPWKPQPPPAPGRLRKRKLQPSAFSGIRLLSHTPIPSPLTDRLSWPLLPTLSSARARLLEQKPACPSRPRGSPSHSADAQFTRSTPGLSSRPESAS